jgi:hypothetical protein
MFVYGGYDSKQGKYLNDIWAYDIGMEKKKCSKMIGLMIALVM